MSKLSRYPVTLDGEEIALKREEIREYFHNTYTLFEKVFELLKDDSVFYRKSELTRHPMIFYFGHTATFFINKLIRMNIIQERINPNFESIFAIGVDEMEWDDLNSKNYSWPKVDEVRAYRQKVRELVDSLISTLDFSLPIRDDSPMWIILMGIEHERIHIETSLVLHRQMPLEYVKEVKEFSIFPQQSSVVQNELITIESRDITLGKEREDTLYGWDNEYGRYKEHIDSFKTSKYLVSNAEYMEFVENGGYENEEYWDEEGREFLARTQAKYPPFWVKEKDGYRYRTLSKIIDMPLSFPVDVNALEAEAFCRYKSKREGVSYALPSEAEYRTIYEQSGLKEVLELDETKANQNLRYCSSSPVDRYSFNGIYDVVGNVWQWSRTAIFGFNGFEVHEAYDDFSTPTFDDKHALILGSSWASSGNLIMKHSRYAFRRHFFQNAGFRYVVLNENNMQKVQSSYEADVLKTCQKDYLQERDFSYIAKAMRYCSSPKKALDFGCQTGRSSFELARYFHEVDGVDISARFIRVGVDLTESNFVECEREAIDLKAFGYERVKNKISFKQADPNNLKANFRGYDFVVANIAEPDNLLETLKTRLNPGAIVVVFEKIESDGFELLEAVNGFFILRVLNV